MKIVSERREFVELFRSAIEEVRGRKRGDGIAMAF